MNNKIKIKFIEKNKKSFLNDYEKKYIIQEKKKYEKSKAAVIEALKIVQKNHNWVPNEAIYEIAKILNISKIDVEEVATFYSQIFRQPVGRYIIRYCDSIVCYINNYKKILVNIEKHLCIKSGETTTDKKFTIIPVCCLGNCDKSPTIMINNDTYNNVSTKNIFSILEQYK